MSGCSVDSLNFSFKGLNIDADVSMIEIACVAKIILKFLQLLVEHKDPQVRQKVRLL